MRCFAGFDTPTLVGPPDGLGRGTPGVASFQVPDAITRAVGELARSHHATVNTVLQGAFAQLLCSLTGQHDVAFGTTVSGRPAEVAGAESMVGLLINTVPVRANITPATTTTRPDRPTARRPQRHPRAPAPGAQRDPPRRRPRHSCSTPCSCTRTTRSTPPRCSAPTGVRHHRVHQPRIHPLPADGGRPAGGRAGPARRIRHRRVRRGQHRGADRAACKRVLVRDDHRPAAAVVVGGSAG